MEPERRKDRSAHEATLAGRESELLGGPVQPRTIPAEGHSGEVDLHVCPDCVSEFVYPTDWEPAAAQSWRVELRCPECEWRGDGVYGQSVVDRFDIVLDEGTEAVLDDLARLSRANMEADIDRFAAALTADHILPEDF